jgi:3-mercaptopyruvate sulfurtransferase SseA
VYGLNDSTLEASVALIKLGAAGYAQVTALPGGLEGWKAGGGKIEQSAAPELPSGQCAIHLPNGLVVPVLVIKNALEKNDCCLGWQSGRKGVSRAFPGF